MCELRKLPYEYDTLEPFIDTHILEFHRNKHQQNYLNKLNELLLSNGYNFKYSLEELPRHIDEFPKEEKENVLFNLGGVINHNLYFSSMSSNKENLIIFY